MSSGPNASIQSPSHAPSHDPRFPETVWESLTGFRSIFDALAKDSRIRVVEVGGRFESDPTGPGVFVAKLVVTCRNGNMDLDTFVGLVDELLTPVARDLQLNRDSGEEPDYFVFFLDREQAAIRTVEKKIEITLDGLPQPARLTTEVGHEKVSGSCEVYCYPDAIEVDSWCKSNHTPPSSTDPLLSFDWGSDRLVST